MSCYIELDINDVDDKAHLKLVVPSVDADTHHQPLLDITSSVSDNTASPFDMSDQILQSQTPSTTTIPSSSKVSAPYT